MLKTKSTSICAVFAIIWCVVFTIALIDPLWLALDLHVPGEPFNKTDFTQPVDSTFYIRNSQLGYRGNEDAHTSVPFHPLTSWTIAALPPIISPNCRLWLISLLSAFGALLVVHRYVREILPSLLDARVLVLTPLLPGGFVIATGNAEIPCLLFTSLLAVSVLQRWPYIYPFLWGALAVLAKPNALYMVAFLSIYLVISAIDRDYPLVKRSLLGIAGIFLAWILWIMYVEMRVGQAGAYWHVRQFYTPPLLAGPLTFVKELAWAIVHSANPGEQLRYITALAIPFVDMWIVLGIPLEEKHKLPILAGLLSIVLVTFVVNNPNKIIVYATTFPGHFATGVIFLNHAFRRKRDLVSEGALERLLRRLAGISYLAFCLLMTVFFVLGTPLEWYY